MTKIRVSCGPHGHNLIAALTQSRPGDVLAISPGNYAIEAVYLTQAQLVGLGEPGSVTLQGQIEIRGTATLSNLTIRASPFHNAIKMDTPGAWLHLDHCTIVGEPAGKYPAIFNGGGVLQLTRTVVHHDNTSCGVSIENGAELHAAGSGVASLAVSGAKAVLTDVQAFQVHCASRARVESHGLLELMPAATMRALVIRNESVCIADRVRIAQRDAEGFCDESVLQLGQVETPGDASLLLLTKGRAVVRANGPGVTVRDVDAPSAPAKPAPAEPAPAEPEPIEPKVVLWRQADAERFEEVIQPHLNVGDTLLLEEGEYSLGSFDEGLLLAVDVSGKGSAERTVIKGSLGVKPGQRVSLSNLTVRPLADHIAVYMRAGGALSMTNVVLDCASPTTASSVYVRQGEVTMSGCVVLASDEDDSIGRVDIDHDAHMVARDSSLGWMWIANGASAELSNCAAYRVSARNRATVTATDTLAIGDNDCDQRMLVLTKGSTATLERVETESSAFEAFVGDSRLTISELVAPERGSVVVYREGDADIQIEGGAVEYRDTTRQQVSAQDSADAPMPQMADAEPDSNAEDRPDQVSPDEGGHSGPAIGDGDPLDEIEALVGLGQVKEQIRAFTRRVTFNQERLAKGLKVSEMTMHSLFLGNPGTGKTTVARLLGKALYRAGAIQRDVFVEVGRPDLVSENVGGSAKLTRAVLERARGGVLFIDEAYSLRQGGSNDFGQEAVDTILTFMENHRDEIVVIFAGYTGRMQDFLAMNEGLKSRIPNRFDFEDYTPDEIADIGYRSLLDSDYTVDEELYRRIVSAKYARSSDRSNGRWVRNVNDELISRLVDRVSGRDDLDDEDLTAITHEDLHQLAGSAPQQGDSVEELLAQLDGMVGLASVKEWVRRLVNRVTVDQRRIELDGAASRPTYHMAFTGNPGTGKTTVARIIARLFHTLGILEHPTVKVVDRSRLVGQWIGHTEANTTRAIDEAMGGVIFVDEAYQLYVPESANDFGQQAIETFLTRLEDDRDKFVAIFAGYTDQMARFFTANPGLRSRVPLTLEFPDYSDEEVAQLVVMELAKSWQFDQAAVSRVAMRAYAQASDRSNGRWARNFAEQLETEQIEHLATHDVPDAELTWIPTEVIEAFGP